ncbi:MAG: hypothetical protein QF486_03450 [Candidatus Woesearchaeota archaeon]|jgi:hypothetical protein|nr:hypothetical protein [Candidatus Woesearchaeota archaeon]MDP7182050.1 hypothetical protein [Candidatus Woesearchaeota archaeon]MDP7198652.1 hypothetical protein [Candidatus Woesearchaeota archaeon]MDP7467626.1 hypothetical protein [Candidatus Woesearchaeota archaeon]MDP7647156.1 hypothetical protein [Candidatus Woesearchaeota archaeon]
MSGVVALDGFGVFWYQENKPVHVEAVGLPSLRKENEPIGSVPGWIASSVEEINGDRIVAVQPCIAEEHLEELSPWERRVLPYVGEVTPRDETFRQGKKELFCVDVHATEIAKRPIQDREELSISLDARAQRMYACSEANGFAVGAEARQNCEHSYVAVTFGTFVPWRG